MEVFVQLGKYMDEYNLNGPRIFISDKSSDSNLQKYQKNFHQTGKLAVFLNAVSVAYIGCADWTKSVTLSIVLSAEVSQSKL